MSSKWSSYLLGELTDWKSGGTPSKKKPEYWNGDIPWISASSMVGGRYSDSSLKITSEGLEAGSRIASKGSILLLVRGSTLHKRIPVGIAERDIAFNQDVKAIKVKPNFIHERVVDDEYLYYWFKANEQNLLEMVEHTGIGAGKLDTKQLHNIQVRLPPWEEQRIFVAKVKSLDEKEILNSKINQTLERINRETFNRLFVNFEPVKAKITARQSGSDDETVLISAMQAISGKSKEQIFLLELEHPEQYKQLRSIADIFPSAMQKSTSGDIPEGWSSLPLDEIASYQNGLALQKFRPENENEYLPVVKISQLKKGYADGEEKASRNIKPECIIDDGDVIFSWSGSLMVDIWCGGKAALNQHLFKVTSDRYPKWLYWNFTKHHLEEFQQIAADKAVTMGHIKREHLHQAVCAVPDNHLISKVNSIFENILDKQINNRLQNVTLIKLRDTLLPELLSGKFETTK